MRPRRFRRGSVSLHYVQTRGLGELHVPPGTRPAHEQHIVLVNRDEILAARVARAET